MWPWQLAVPVFSKWLLSQQAHFMEILICGHVCFTFLSVDSSMTAAERILNRIIDGESDIHLSEDEGPDHETREGESSDLEDPDEVDKDAEQMKYAIILCGKNRFSFNNIHLFLLVRMTPSCFSHVRPKKISPQARSLSKLRSRLDIRKTFRMAIICCIIVFYFWVIQKRLSTAPLTFLLCKADVQLIQDLSVFTNQHIVQDSGCILNVTP